ncbi:MAG: hypothetical protein ACRD04_01400 [Terriglobales bacterium]
MQSVKEYQIRPLDTSPGGLREISDLFARGQRDLPGRQASLDWQYNQNPAGLALGFNAYSQGLLVAHYAAIPIKARLFGKVCAGILSINTRTDPAHQRQGLFYRLAELTYAQAREANCEFVIGVANQNSVHGFTKKLGFQLVGLLETRFVAHPVAIPETGRDFAVVWDRPAVAWRLSNPGRKYYYHRSSRGRGLLLGRSGHFSVLVGTVDASAVPVGIAERPRSFNPFLLWIGTNGAATWKHSFSMTVPQALKPVPLNLIFRDLRENRKLSLEGTWFWAMDFDAY